MRYPAIEYPISKTDWYVQLYDGSASPEIVHKYDLISFPDDVPLEYIERLFRGRDELLSGVHRGWLILSVHYNGNSHEFLLYKVVWRNPNVMAITRLDIRVKSIVDYFNGEALNTHES